ncbi:MAG: proton-conducting transporter membrane subunit [Chloroflexi bacterium]|nr:proton-conducting transporter membrane subunit [Chloroflexota bacterium]
MTIAEILADPNLLPWFIPLAPLLAFFVIVLLSNKAKLVSATSAEYGGHHPDYEGTQVPVVKHWSRVMSVWIGLIAAVISLILAGAVVLQALDQDQFGIHVFADQIAWMDSGTEPFMMGVLVDPLTAVMLIMVPIAVLMIFIYSVGYMAHDPRQARFFALISLFAAAMLTLVVADNLLLLFVGWEVMGLCSYMLIGFWYEKKTAYEAAIKAFMTTRVADVVMLLGFVYLYAITGTLSFRSILYDASVLQLLESTPAIILGSWGVSAAGLIGVFLIIGTVGKSAQFPLHTWLPDAMEGPTPVSAMIHAAAMVSAGIYAIIRLFPLLSAGGDAHHGHYPLPLVFLVVVGGFTALFAATIAVAQNDVKRVLAYSTISQLGFMAAALGIGAYISATFHLIMHAFFKALLFMASGAVIHGMEHGEHHVHSHDHSEEEHEAEQGHAFDPQDMLNMGGLRKTMPVTFVTFLIGGLSLAGFPLITAGFWSKDEILADAWYGLSHGYAGHIFVFVMLLLAAFLTAFYTMRQLGLTFMGEARTEEARHANLGQGLVSFTMTLPLIILAFFAILAGYVGVHPDFPLLGSIFSAEYNPFFRFVGATLLEVPEKLKFDTIPVLFSFGIALGGIGLGWLLYWRKPLAAQQEDPLIGILGLQLHTLLKNKYYIDEWYRWLFLRPAHWVAHVVTDRFLDRTLIDGILHGIARVFVWLGDLMKVLNTWLIDGVGDGIPEGIAHSGRWLRRIQTGRVQQYLLFVVAAAILVGAVVAVTMAAGS